jgi:hypothetical protein
MRRLKVRTVVKAIRKNGLTKIKGQYLKYGYLHSEQPTAGCAIGQAAYNLGVNAANLYTGLPDYLAAYIVSLNDETDKTLPQIADEVEKNFGTVMDKRISVR